MASVVPCQLLQTAHSRLERRRLTASATFAAKSAIDFTFGKLQLEKIEIVMHPENVASRRVAEAIGATFHGIVKERLMFRGDLVEAAVYQLRRII